MTKFSGKFERKNDYNLIMNKLNYKLISRIKVSFVICRDSKEILKQLNPEEKREFTSKENSRLLSLGTTPSYSSPRREKALKIYLDSK